MTKNPSAGSFLTKIVKLARGISTRAIIIQRMLCQRSMTKYPVVKYCMLYNEVQWEKVIS